MSSALMSLKRFSQFHGHLFNAVFSGERNDWIFIHRRANNNSLANNNGNYHTAGVKDVLIRNMENICDFYAECCSVSRFKK